MQGLTEALPVSSSAHLLLLERRFPGLLPPRAADPLTARAHDAALHAATGLALAVVAAGDLRAVPRGQLALSLAPAALAGSVLRRWFAPQPPAPVVAGLVGAGGVLLLASARSDPTGRSFSEHRPRDVLVSGAAQAAALTPGVSRAAAAYLAGRSCGLEPHAAARLSRVLAVPVSLAGLGALLPPLVGAGSPAAATRFGVVASARWAGPALAAGVSAVTCAAASRRLGWASRHGLHTLGTYRLALAAAWWLSERWGSA